MARPEKNTVEYFPHKIGDGKKIFYIENKYKNDGYATWYRILERLAKTEYHYLDLSDTKELMYLAAKCHISEELLIDIINDLARLGAIDKELWQQHIIWSETFIESIKDVYDKRSNECITIIGLRELLNSLRSPKPIMLPLQDDVNTGTKLNYTKLNLNKTIKVSEISDFDKLKTFEIFWDLYDKKVGRPKSESLWLKLTPEEKSSIFVHVPKYKIAQPDKKYRKDPQTFLRNKSWNDEIIMKNTNGQQSALEKF